MLVTNEIYQLMKNDPTFVGVYPIDRLPVHILPKKSGIIINLDENYKDGSHWVAVKLGKYMAYYFDSFGRYPPNKIIAFMERNSKIWTYNKKIYQSELTSFCGYYCVLFLLYGAKKFFSIMKACNFESNQKQINRIFN